MRKILVTCVAMAVLACATVIPVSAADMVLPQLTQEQMRDLREQADLEELDIWFPVQRWTATQSIFHGVTIKNNIATSTCVYTAYSTTSTINLSLTLQKYEGNSWKDVKTWRASDTFNCAISEKTNVSSGSYRTKTVGKVYNSSGKLLETVTVYSSVKVV